MSKRIIKPVAPRLHFTKAHVEGFTRWLRGSGYTETSTVETIRLLAGWADWMHKHRFGPDTILAGLEASNNAFKGKKSIRRYASVGRLFVRYLQEQNVLPPPRSSPTPAERWPVIAVFRTWARQHRGMADTTLDLWQRCIVDLLETLGDDPDAYSALALRAFMLERAKRYKIGRLKTYAVATRGFLRFLIATGRCPSGREYAVPTIADWKLATVPKYLVAEDIERAIAACDGERRLRDRAIVLLLARLGLRASETANLKITDIDWKNGRLAVFAGKSRRAEWLPLTQEVGDAIVAYLEKTRPRLRTPRLFLTEFAPLRPITRITIKCIVRRTLHRAGIESPHRGAHVLRHSAATAMLRHGVSLTGVGAVLRHRSPDMTMHYAKVDFGLLSEIAQPWVGRLPC
ncbi:MAG: tyrosine-type recombinase/integrase [Alphaproteobacteria bacterium]|nr:tyrosine-type recombinase/integrase [Alphaproteobacteria bacterium]